MTFNEPPERVELRAAVADLAAKYGSEYYRAKAREDAYLTELWREAGGLGYLGVNLPEEYGGGGGGIADLAAVLEELSAAGCPTLMMVVSPAICGTVLARFGTPEQRRRWLPGLAAGESVMAFAITEPDAGSNAHRITTTARRDGGGWVLNGRKTFISGVDVADAVLVVGRIEDEDTGRLSAALFAVPTDTPGFEARRIEMDIVSRTTSSSCSWTTSACPATPWSATPTPASSSSSPDSTPNASWPRPWPPAAPGTPWTRRSPTPGSARCGGTGPSVPTRGWHTRWPR